MTFRMFKGYSPLQTAPTPENVIGTKACFKITDDLTPASLAIPFLFHRRQGRFCHLPMKNWILRIGRRRAGEKQETRKGKTDGGIAAFSCGSPAVSDNPPGRKITYGDTGFYSCDDSASQPRSPRLPPASAAPTATRRCRRLWKDRPEERPPTSSGL